MVLKLWSSLKVSHYPSNCFRPLAGIWFWNLSTEFSVDPKAYCFRPLAGIWFWNNYLWMHDGQWACFRPLAGIWFWNSIHIKFCTDITIVSVPLRGYGFEITSTPSKATTLRGFRPLAGIWFWNKTSWRTSSKQQAFPSPCGDMVLK